MFSDNAIKWLSGVNLGARFVNTVCLHLGLLKPGHWRPSQVAIWEPEIDLEGLKGQAFVYLHFGQ